MSSHQFINKIPKTIVSNPRPPPHPPTKKKKKIINDKCDLKVVYLNLVSRFQERQKLVIESEKFLWGSRTWLTLYVYSLWMESNYFT